MNYKAKYIKKTLLKYLHILFVNLENVLSVWHSILYTYKDALKIRISQIYQGCNYNTARGPKLEGGQILLIEFSLNFTKTVSNLNKIKNIWSKNT